jgi:hypothetical protein
VTPIAFSTARIELSELLAWIYATCAASLTAAGAIASSGTTLVVSTARAAESAQPMKIVVRLAKLAANQARAATTGCPVNRPHKAAGMNIQPKAL